MAWVIYTAKRSLTGGFVNGQAVTYELPLRWAGLSRSAAPMVDQRVSLSGVNEAYFYRNEITWNAASRPLTPGAADLMVMFLDSVADGQVFQFSPTVAPAYRNATLGLGGYDGGQEPGRDTLTSYSFQIIERP